MARLDDGAAPLLPQTPRDGLYVAPVAREGDPWARALTTLVGTRVKSARDRLKWSAREVADRCERLGYRIEPQVIANMETGRRINVPVAELLVLAAALNVPAAFLLFPVETSDTVELLPGRTVSAWRAFQEVTGEGRARGMTGRGVDEQRQLGSALAVLDRLRWQDEELDRWERAASRERRADRQLTAESDDDDERVARLRGEIESAARDRRAAEETLARMRADMRERGISPGDVLPDELAHLDEQGGEP